MSEIQFFGEVDKTRDGNNASEMPSWFHDVHLEKMEEDVSKKKRMLTQGRVPQDNIFMVQNEIKADEEKILEIKKSKPTLIGGQKDMVYKEYLSVGQQIAEALPTRRDELNGFANPREELIKSNTPGIKISEKMANAMGVKTQDGKITLKQAQKFYKLSGKILGENSNIERIRREGRSESYRTMEDLTKKILEKVAG